MKDSSAPSLRTNPLELLSVSRFVLANRFFSFSVYGILLLSPASTCAQYYTKVSSSGCERDLPARVRDDQWGALRQGRGSRIDEHRTATSIHGPSMTFQRSVDTSLAEVGSWLWGECNGVALKDSFGFIGNGLYIHTLNISRVDSPYIVGEYFIGKPDVVVKDISVRDSLLYVLTGRSLMIMDCRDARALVSIAEIPVSNFAPWRLSLSGDYAYIGDFYGIVIVDIF